MSAALPGSGSPRVPGSPRDRRGELSARHLASPTPGPGLFKAEPGAAALPAGVGGRGGTQCRAARGGQFQALPSLQISPARGAKLGGSAGCAGGSGSRVLPASRCSAGLQHPRPRCPRGGRVTPCPMCHRSHPSPPSARRRLRAGRGGGPAMLAGSEALAAVRLRRSAGTREAAGADPGCGAPPGSERCVPPASRLRRASRTSGR